MEPKIISISHYFDIVLQEYSIIDIQQEAKRMLAEKIATYLIENRQDLFAIRDVDEFIKELNLSCYILSKEEFNLLQKDLLGYLTYCINICMSGTQCSYKDGKKHAFTLIRNFILQDKK